MGLKGNNDLIMKYTKPASPQPIQRNYLTNYLVLGSKVSSRAQKLAVTKQCFGENVKRGRRLPRADGVL